MGNKINDDTFKKEFHVLIPALLLYGIRVGHEMKTSKLNKTFLVQRKQVKWATGHTRHQPSPKVISSTIKYIFSFAFAKLNIDLSHSFSLSLHALLRFALRRWHFICLQVYMHVVENLKQKNCTQAISFHYTLVIYLIFIVHHVQLYRRIRIVNTILAFSTSNSMYNK